MKTLDVVEKDLNTIRDTLAKDARLREFCVNPSLQRATKVIEFAKVLDKLKVNPQTKNMLARSVTDRWHGRQHWGSVR
ncbi:Oligomycin sensitivity-conferring protein [Fasciola gigantica]|uniref:Oligomycin sensitivity conferral protein n=1 Tax=Fasciola gigantica TaxID=46835 RepID=A0A504ZAP3_FASGI|nr:Oligomycin sensitivity-conferring protein [Fasciola gigantica]